MPLRATTRCVRLSTDLCAASCHSAASFRSTVLRNADSIHKVLGMTSGPVIVNRVEPISRDVSDGLMAAAVAQGDHQAFELLFHLYYNRLCVFAEAQVRSSVIAEELVEDVFCWIWEHRSNWGSQVTGSGVKPYLYAAVRNRALRHLARQQVATREYMLAESRADSLGTGAAAPPLDEAVETNEFVRAVERAVAELPPRCRQVFALHRQHELSYAEIAHIMGISIRTVENQLAKALKTLRVVLAAWGPRPDPVSLPRD